MERQKKDGNNFSPQNKLVEESEGNEENGYPYQTPTKQRKSIPKTPMKPTRHHERRNSASNQ
jgi:hypothetical protein